MTSTPDVIPRVPIGSLAEFVGRRVLLVAKVEGVDPSGTTVTLAAAGVSAAAPDAPQQQLARVVVQRPAGGGGGAYDTAFAEVDGVVVDATTVREESHTNFSDNFGAFLRVLCSRGRATAAAAPTKPNAKRPPLSLLSFSLSPQTRPNPPTQQPTKQKQTDFNMYTEALKTIAKPQFAAVFA